jgi:hypothetical protein
MSGEVRSPKERLTVREWVGRALWGLVLGFIWSSLICLAWVTLLSLVHGSLDRALEKQKRDPQSFLLVISYLAATPASFLGGLVGPLALGVAGRKRRLVLSSSAWGGAMGTVLSLAMGLPGAWVGWEYAPRTPLFLLLPLILGVPAGLLGGWLGGRVIARGLG